jgi:putative ABC transport system ATP-binding protein
MSTQSELLVEARGIAMRYGGASVLDDVSLQIREGSLTAIEGPSGSGKTTLLGVLSLLLSPTAGRLSVQGQDSSKFSDFEKSRLRNEFFGTIFQSPHLVGSLSVLDNVLVPELLSGRTKKGKRQALAWLERLGLKERVDYLPHMLSVGQKRRVAIARALVMKPAVVFADEPTNDLDESRAGQVADFLCNLPAEGYSVVLVTHDGALAGRAPERWRLREGRLERLTAPALS